MWDFFETVRHRHSVRKYQADAAVDESKLHAILEMACAAPSAGDLQSYRIIVVTADEQRKQLANIAEEQNFLAEAPVALVFCADTSRAGDKYGDRGANLYALQDATIAAAYAQLAIVAAGMASAWVGYFDEKLLGDFLELSTGERPIAILSVGYAAELPESTPRRRLDEVVSFK